MNIDKLQAIAERLKKNQPLNPLQRGETPFFMNYQGKVVGKERPRAGRSGQFYTPKATREFEKQIARAARHMMHSNNIVPYRSAVAVNLTVFDQLPLDWPNWMLKLAQANYIFDFSGADLDNKEKAILDAINKVVYDDDRQVVQLYKYRQFTHKEGFTLTVTPVGLTKHDLENLRKLMS